MYPKQFTDQAPGKVEQAFDPKDGTYWAFVPNPLPPEIPIDWELAKALDEAGRALSELAGVGQRLPNPHLLITPFIRKEAVLSSQIEGTETQIEHLYA